MNDLSHYQSDHLILLIGGNPLPNAVAGLLLAKKESQITLIHSSATFPIAQRLAKWFKDREFPQTILKETKESEANSIYTAVESAFKQISHESIGLNYTGGTKTMSVHAHEAVKQFAQERRLEKPPIFSYLDARTLEMVFDPEHPAKGEFSQPESLEGFSEIGLADLLTLHEWQNKTEPTNIPFLAKSSDALLQIYQTSAALDAWNSWKEAVLHETCRRPDRPDKWKSQGQLRSIMLPWPTDPSLQPLVNALQADLDQDDELRLADAAKTCGKKKIEDICKWLYGGFWLETITLQALQTITANCHLHDVLMNLNPELPGQETDFELDVVAMKGYQLFALSCSTSESKPLLKHKLMEAFIRARQLGGDEARIALVSCSENPDELEREMRQSLDMEGQIKVFGLAHLETLANALQEWIDTSTQT